MKRILVGLWKEEEGQDLTEYGLLVALVSLAAIAAMRGVASAISAVFSTASSSMS
jgi:pilus assembly protein Flp/PilA